MVCSVSEVLDEKPANTYCPKKRPNVCEILAGTPINYLCNSALIWHATGDGAPVAEHGNFFGTEERFDAGVCAAAILHSVYDPIKVLEVLPNESPDTWVFWDAVLFS